jgi:5'-methylthioinosine phosphorylase
MNRNFALIVGSGFESFTASSDAHHVTTRFGEPSAPIRPVDFQGRNVLVLPRHGDDHSLPPHIINYRANLMALKELGADAVIALNTVGVVSGIREAGMVASTPRRKARGSRRPRRWIDWNATAQTLSG